MNILKTWQNFSKIPGGRYLFGKFLGLKVPYSGSVDPEIVELSPGKSKVKIQDRRANRNHLQSIHAVALMNLGEISTGLALMSAIPENSRAILKGFSIEYLKKARGELTGEAQHEIISSNEKKEYTVEAIIKNREGAIVCKAKALWVVGPAK